MKYIHIVFWMLLASGALAAPIPFFAIYDYTGERLISIQPGGAADQIGLAIEKTERDGADFYAVKLCNLGKKDRALRLTAYIPFSRENAYFLGTPYVREKAVPGKVHSFLFGGNPTSDKAVGFSRYPFAGITDGTNSVAFALDLSKPALSRIEYDTNRECFAIQFELGIIPERPEAEVRFCVYEFQSNWGFRAILDKYYRLFPADFEVRSRDQGLCLAFAEPSKINNVEDFGIRYREATYEGRWNYDTNVLDLKAMPRIQKEVEYGNSKNIISFRYHEPGTFWVPLKDGFPRTYESALAYTEYLAKEGHPKAKALFESGMTNVDGKYQVAFSKQNWNNGCVWAISTLPGEKLFNEWFSADKLESYRREDGRILAGEFYDSMGGYMRDPLDFRRSNMVTAAYPLVYDRLSGRLAASFQLCHAEYASRSSAAIHDAGKMTAANNVRNFMFSRCFDIFVGEMDWKHSSWKPASPEELFFIRAMTKGKPYTILQNTSFKKFNMEDIDRYMRRAVANGIFPGFFSDRSNGKNYFRTPELYEMARHLFKKYIPMCKKLSEAGWEPVTNAHTDRPEILVERFGKLFFTIYNDSEKTQTFTLRFDDEKIDRLISWITPEKTIAGKGGVFQLQLDAEELQIFELSEKGEYK